MPILEEDYHKWRNSQVTRRLFEDLELSVVDSFQDYIADDAADRVAMQTMMKQGAAMMVERVIDWAPAGVEVEDED
jgi:hypothetical protein